MSMYYCYFTMRHYMFRSIWLAQTELVLASDVTEAKIHILEQFKEENVDGLDRTLEWIKRT